MMNRYELNETHSKIYIPVTELMEKSEPYKYDNVKIPKHYNAGKYEVIDIIEDVLKVNKLNGGQAFCIGNALKYICRCNCKGKYEEDLNKAIQYLKRAIKGEW